MSELVVTLPITHVSGLHARASTKFVEIAQSYRCDVSVTRGDGQQDVAWANGKSVIEILTLGVQLGDEITLRVDGKDASGALEALTDLVKADFHGI